MSLKRLKDGSHKLLADIASTAVFSVAVSSFLTGLGTLYADSYMTGRLPSPTSFTAASYAFTAGLGAIFMLRQIKKPIPIEKEKEAEGNIRLCSPLLLAT